MRALSSVEKSELFLRSFEVFSEVFKEKLISGVTRENTYSIHNTEYK